MSQTFLTENPPMILDATCSYAKTRYFSRHATIHIDNRPEVKPDYVMDNTHLKFPPAFFDEIDYDPPHVIRPGLRDTWMKKFKEYRRKQGRTSPAFFERYWFWESKDEYLNNIRGVNREFYRCLKPIGILRCKISVEEGRSNRKVNIEEFLELMTNFMVAKDRITRSRSNLGKNTVHWLTMKPKPKASGAKA